MYELNVLGTLRVTQALLPQLRADGGRRRRRRDLDRRATARTRAAPGTRAPRPPSGCSRRRCAGRSSASRSGSSRSRRAPWRPTSSRWSASTATAQRAAAVYDGYQPLVADDIADAIAWTLSRPPHVNIDLLVVRPRAQASNTKIARTERLTDRPVATVGVAVRSVGGVYLRARSHQPRPSAPVRPPARPAPAPPVGAARPPTDRARRPDRPRRQPARAGGAAGPARRSSTARCCREGSPRGVVLGALVVLALGVLEAFLVWCRRALILTPGTTVERDMRTDLFRHLLDLPVEFHDRWSGGQLLSRIMSDLRHHPAVDGVRAGDAAGQRHDGRRRRRPDDRDQPGARAGVPRRRGAR